MTAFDRARLIEELEATLSVVIAYIDLVRNVQCLIVRAATPETC